MIVVNFNPEIFSLGPIHIRWYGLIYVIGFLIAGQLLKILSKEGTFDIPKEKIDSFITYELIGMLVGARVFYVFIYGQDLFWENPLNLFKTWEGGLSFHGAIVGFIFAAICFGKKNHIRLLKLSDILALVGAQGLFLGRIGNFINGELYGRITDVPWGMIFPLGGGPMPRHPSQLYEAILEGAVLWGIIWLLRKRVTRYGVLTSIFLSGYGVFRFLIEFFREPDIQMGLYLGENFTMGQILCFFMSCVGAGVYFYVQKKDEYKV